MAEVLQNYLGGHWVTGDPRNKTVRMGALVNRAQYVSPEVAEVKTGHGNATPQSLHGGPGRAGGGEELGGTRALSSIIAAQQYRHRRP